MTTDKPYHKPNVTFSKPAIGPKIYLAKGPSGWPEQFSRKLADEAIDKLLHPLRTEDVLGSFRVAMRLEARDEQWGDVIGYLSKITGTHEQQIPEVCSVAFWGRYVILKRNEGTN